MVIRKSYTLEQIRLYLQRCESLGDAVYYLSKIDEVIATKNETEEEEDFDE
jgi:hypothetical protein